MGSPSDFLGHEPEVQCPSCGSQLVLPDGTCASCGASVPQGLAHLPTLVVPDDVEPISGWRAWRLKRVPKLSDRLVAGEGEPCDLRLQSVTKTGTLWEPRHRAIATCKGRPSDDRHPVPSNGCKCGLYAARTLDHLLSMTYPGYDEARGGSWIVVGEVAMWGGYVEGTQGWRAEFAYPTVLYLPYEAWQLATPLQETYGVPVKLRNWLGESLEKINEEGK